MNRLIYPNSLYPLQGDVSSSAGSNQSVVTGIQTVPILQVIPLKSGSILQYDSNIAHWHPLLIASILVNGITVSTDYWISVNNYHLLVSVNGTGVAP